MVAGAGNDGRRGMLSRSDGVAMFGLLFLIFMMAMDPVILFIRRRWLDQDESRYVPPVKLFARMTYGIPAASALVLAFIAWKSGKWSWAYAISLGYSVFLGRYFHKRSRGEVARLPRIVVDPSDPEFQNDFNDFAVTIMAIAWILMPVVFWWTSNVA
jgi:hypothetical protein